MDFLVMATADKYETRYSDSTKSSASTATISPASDRTWRNSFYRVTTTEPTGIAFGETLQSQSNIARSPGWSYFELRLQAQRSKSFRLPRYER